MANFVQWDSIDKSEVQERKIRVVFLPPHGSTPAPPAQAETPRKQSGSGGKLPFDSFSASSRHSDIVVTLRNQHESTPDVAPPPAYSSPSDFIAAAESKAGEERDDTGLAPAGIAASSVAKHTEPTYDELKQQLAQAEKLIGQLKQDQGGLRQRKTGGAADDGKPGSKPTDLAQQVRAGTEGVPVQITAVLCLLSFLLAYLFF